MTKTKAPVTLTAKDWTEIYYAVEDKRDRVMNGDLGDGTPSAARWEEHLTAILGAIGPDGENAAALGVMPVEGFAPGPCIHGDYQTCEDCEGES